MPNPGRPKLTTTEDEFNILFAAVENPFRKLNDLSKTTISRLRENKYYACVARAKEFLSPGHRAYRLQFAEQYINFDKWDRTLFVDESTF